MKIGTDKQNHTLNSKIRALKSQIQVKTLKIHLNPSKSNIGKISKKILDAINSKLRQETSFNQWKSTNDCIRWFSNLPNKQSLRFIKLDIQNFYPEIGLKLLQDAIEWARNYVAISKEDIEIIMHCRKSFLFFKGDVYVKSENPEFSVEQGSLDSAEISELVGLFILSKLAEIIPKEQKGIYRDDMIIALKTTGRGSELMGQQLSVYTGRMILSHSTSTKTQTILPTLKRKWLTW